MQTLTEVKPWTIYNAKEGKIFELSHNEFSDLLKKPGVKLEGKEIVINIHGQSFKTWIDASINN